jgi:hypothetical protein
MDSSLRESNTNIVFLNTMEKEYTIITAIFDNIQKANEMKDWIKGFEGVTKVSMGVLKEFALVTHSLDESIDSKLKAQLR